AAHEADDAYREHDPRRRHRLLPPVLRRRCVSDPPHLISNRRLVLITLQAGGRSSFTDKTPLLMYRFKLPINQQSALRKKARFIGSPSVIGCRPNVWRLSRRSTTTSD